jgi:hypothetical protein
MFRPLALAIVVVAIHASDLRAQGIGYVVAGPAGHSGFFGSGSSAHVAGGAEVLVRGIAGVGAEIGFFDRLVTASLDGVFHVPVGGAQTRPFLAAGFTKMGIGDGEGDALNEWNVGAGVDFWTRERRAWRFDIRDHVRPDVRGTVHYWTVRVGMAFR